MQYACCEHILRPAVRGLNPISALLFLTILLLLGAGCRHASPLASTNQAPPDQAPPDQASIDPARAPGDVAEATALTDQLVLIDSRTQEARCISLDTTQDLQAEITFATGFAGGFQCICFADWVMVWQANQHPICMVGLQPDGAITWPDGPWPGDLQLPSKTSERVEGTLKAQYDLGVPLPDFIPPIPK